MKKIIIYAIFLLGISPCFSQNNISCDQAYTQIQNYSYNVIYSYNQNLYWINNNIQPYYRQNYYNSLIQWYNQEASYINSTYSQISYNCQNQIYSERNSNTIATDFGNQITQNRQQLSQEQSKKKIRIKIPDNPVGWKN